MKTDNKNKGLSELKEEDFEKMEPKEIIDKIMGDEAKEIILHVKDIKQCKTIITISFITTFIAVILSGGSLLSYIAILPALFYGYGLYRLNKSLPWHVRSLKSSARIYSDAGYSIFVEPHIRSVEKFVEIGERY